MRRIKVYERVEQLGLDDFILPDEKSETLIKNLLSDFYRGKSHNYKKNFFDEYLKGIKSYDNALQNLYNYIKFRLENNIDRYSLEYIQLKFNCSLEQAKELQLEQRLKAAPSLESYISRWGENVGTQKHKLTVTFVSNIPLNSFNGYEIVKGISLALTQADVKYPLDDLFNEIEANKSRLESITFFKDKFGKRYNNRFNTYLKVYEYFVNMFRVEGCFLNFEMFLNTSLSRSNLYNLDVTILRFNCNEEEAKTILEGFKREVQDRSLEGFIKRHGEVLGEKKYNQFLERCSAAALKKKELYKEEYDYKIRINNKRCVEYYTSRGHSLDEAKELVSEYQRNNSGNQVTYWMNKGYTEEEATAKVESLMNRLGSSYEYIKQKYPDNWEEVIEHRLANYRKTIGANEPEWQDGFRDYSYACRSRTDTTVKVYLNQIEGNQFFNDPEYQLDHKFSVKAGFLLGINPVIIAHYTNLAYIKKEQNQSKSALCSKDINDLFGDYYESQKN